MDTAARRTHIAAQDATLLLVPAQAHLPPLLLPRIQRRRRHVLLPLLHHPCSTEVLPDGQGEPPVFQFVPIASGPGTGHY